MKKLTVVTLMLVCGIQFASADNWPQWRGAKLDSVSNETNLPDSLSKNNRLWRFEMPGPGGSSPIVWEDKIFVASVDGADLSLLCIDTNGNMKWKKKLDGKNSKIRMDSGNSASPSPVTDGSHVWIMLGNGILHCFDFDGKIVWKKDLQKEYGKFAIQFGMTSTPVLDDGMLYVQLVHGSMRAKLSSKGKIVALDAKSGDEVWKHVRLTDAVMENKHAYSSPTLYRNDDKEFLIVHGADFTTGHDLKDGKELWRVGGLNPKASYNNFLRLVSSPVCGEGLVVIPTAKNGPVFGIEPDEIGSVSEFTDAIRWELESGTPDVATPVISNGRVYLARENGVVICLDAKNGQTKFRKRLVRDKHRSTPIAADGKIYLVGRNGQTVVFEDAPKFKLISQSELNEDTTASPAISNGKILIRSNKSLMSFGVE